MMVAGGRAGGEQPLDVQQQDLAILLCHHADVQDGTGSGGVRLAEKSPVLHLDRMLRCPQRSSCITRVEPDSISPMTSVESPARKI